MPGQVPVHPRIPSPTSTSKIILKFNVLKMFYIQPIFLPVNTLELIGSPTTSRPRVKQPSGDNEFHTLSPASRKRTPKYENTEQADPAVPMPGTPSQNVKVDWLTYEQLLIF